MIHCLLFTSVAYIKSDFFYFYFLVLLVYLPASILPSVSIFMSVLVEVGHDDSQIALDM